ncbi:hypothetical protein HPB52_018197 [Rhipicephalus sanguineus]|uniref:Cadherin domain-containing protein n=1 Tax=Rhipicephalus sanguineus TaxID=34632 RepID=A0A9D4Q6W4_RHISA|nr:hypothetical protein HPB52_018197 [Rhipicephalus sanguineus]
MSSILSARAPGFPSAILTTHSHTNSVLHTSRPLDREQRPHYFLVAHVRDVARWEWQCNSSIEVLLSDVNDNPPVFGQKAYELALPEDTPAGRLVAHVHALDRDLVHQR